MGHRELAHASLFRLSVGNSSGMSRELGDEYRCAKLRLIEALTANLWRPRRRLKNGSREPLEHFFLRAKKIMQVLSALVVITTEHLESLRTVLGCCSNKLTMSAMAEIVTYLVARSCMHE